MAMNVAQKLIQNHLVSGHPDPGEEISISIDQTLTQDATGTLVMLELEAMELARVQTEVSVQYVDHNLLQEDNKNPDDHLYLYSAAQRFGVWFSRPGNGVSHPVHQQNFGQPGKTLLGSDSHTPAGGALGMLAIGAGGIEVALAMAGHPFFLQMPQIWGVRLVGKLPPWVSAKDIILEMLRRFDVDGGVGCLLEYHGPGLEELTAMDRHVIANMGAELGATSTVFPADKEVRRYLRSQEREEDFVELLPDPGATYDRETELDLSTLEPLIAMPSSPGNVVPVREVEGREIYQAYIGSSANPGYADFAVAAEIVRGNRVSDRVSFDINPTSRQLLAQLTADDVLLPLIESGARIHQAGCNGCIGMGQAPATGKLSLRTVPRNFPGRSGTRDDQVSLVSPETAAASALAGRITDPRTLGTAPRRSQPKHAVSLSKTRLFVPPLSPEASALVEVQKGPNIVALPQFGKLPDQFDVPVLLKVGDDVSTDEILPAGARVLPFRSNIPAISSFVFHDVDETYAERARQTGDHVIVGGSNYGQGSSREHAALAPRHLGLRVVLAGSFARIHRQNLVNFGVLPLTFTDPADEKRVRQGDHLRLKGLASLKQSAPVTVENLTCNETFEMKHGLTSRQCDIMKEGGMINWVRHHQPRSMTVGSHE